MEAIAQKLTRKEKIAQGIAKLPGSKKKRAADARKERNKTIAFATLRNYPTSPRKMRAAAAPMRKLLMSAIANWREKFADQAHLEECLYIKEIKVDGASMLKRFQPAPQGRAHRIRKRSNHITIVLDVHNQENA